MSCNFLKDNGVPSVCFLWRVEAAVVGIALPFFLYGLWRSQNAIKPPAAVSLTIFARTCRTLALYTSAAFALLCASQFSVVELPLEVTSVIVAALHYAELYVQPRLVASSELLLWWIAQFALSGSRFVSEPSALNATMALLAAATWILESCSSPWDPQGYDEASIFGRINMSFLNTMIKTAQERIITTDDFAGYPEGTSMEIAYERFMKRFNEYSQGNKYRVIGTLLTFYRSRLILLLTLNILADGISYTQPLLLSWFLRSLQEARNSGTIKYESLYFAFAVGCAQLLTNAVTGLRGNAYNAMYLDTRTALMEVIYRKALNISSDARLQYDSSKIMNLLNVDTTMVQMAYAQLSTLVSAPIGLVICTVQLYMFLGNATLASIPLYLIYLPYTSWSTKRQVRRFPESMAAKDERAKSTLSIMRNMKSLKLYAWEEPYEQQVFNDRKKELDVTRRNLKLRVALRGISGQLNNAVMVAVFLAFLYYSDNPLTPEIVFPALAMISLVSEPLFTLPATISELGNAFTSQARILKFLEQPDETFENYYREPAVASDDFDTPLIEMDHARVTWGSAESSATAVEALTLSLRRGDLCCVLGTVGSGKSALLKALCGQNFVKDGSIKVRGSLAYAGQEPWLQYRSLRDNVLFGLEYDQEFYDATIKACDLENDIALFPDGDLTEIGEKGISLSGGQKARVSLARAVYSRADVYILDDVLSAVDQHVSTKLLKNLLSSEGMLAQKVIIMATHTAKSLKESSQLLCLSRGGRAVFNGATHDAGSEDLMSATGGSLASPIVNDLLPKKDYDRRKEAKARSRSSTETAGKIDPKNPNANFQEQDFTKDEMLPDVPIYKIYVRYLTAAGRLVTSAALLLTVAAVVSASLISIWLTVWSDKSVSGVWDSRGYIIVFILIIGLNATLTCSSYYCFLGFLALKASQVLHDKMLDNVVHSPMSFFERTPLGAIMSRFTGDISSLDDALPQTMFFFLNMLLTTIMNLSIAVFGSPLIILVLIPMFPKYNQYRRTFVPASRQLQKLMSAAQGPLLSHIEESIRGALTLTAFQMKSQFIKGFESRGTYWAHTSFLRYAMRRWLNSRIALMTATVVIASMLSVISLVRFANLPVSIAGVVLYGVRIAGMRLSRIIELWTRIEVTVIGVERVFNYIDLPNEAPHHLDPSVAIGLEQDWPSHGVIKFTDYSTKYRPDLDDVLHKINIAISAKEKVGVVGRTGAGKSTLTMALFRILEASSGNIDIDAVTTSKLGLFDLRSRLSIIPQEAQIFKGTLRQNLDPLNTADDTKLWHVLELCHLKGHFENGLDTDLLEGGENISRGQAQLICLGRALMRPTKILVLDEATASVDANTDSLVQSTIRREFSDRTIITIAHRLDTVMDSDKILVLSEGRVVEFDAPQKLLEQKGAFYELCNSKR